MKIIITGGIGSGRLTISKLLTKSLTGKTDIIQSVYCPHVSEIGDFHISGIDQIVESLYKDPEIKNLLLNKIGTCDKKVISDKIFNGASQIEQLVTEIFNPFIKRNMDMLFSNFHNLIFEHHSFYNSPYKINQPVTIVSVICPINTRINRIKERDNISDSKIKNIISKQASDKDNISIADIVIENSYEKNDNILDPTKLRVARAVDQIRKRIAKGSKIGIVSGSFDPITLGHTWVIQKALDLVDYVVVAIANNNSKKYLLSSHDRELLVRDSLNEVLSKEQLMRIIIDFIPENELIVSYAESIEAKFIFRGIRGFTDLEYENQLNLLQKKISPEVETVFFLTPRHLIEISSSLIKASMNLREWEKVTGPYVTNCVLEKLRKLHET